MWNCPVCGMKNPGIVCMHCGMLKTEDYTAQRTLCPVSEREISLLFSRRKDWSSAQEQQRMAEERRKEAELQTISQAVRKELEPLLALLEAYDKRFSALEQQLQALQAQAAPAPKSAKPDKDPEKASYSPKAAPAVEKPKSGSSESTDKAPLKNGGDLISALGQIQSQKNSASASAAAFDSVDLSQSPQEIYARGEVYLETSEQKGRPPIEAKVLFRIAAERDYAPAQAALSYCFFATNMKEEGMKWLRKAADRDSIAHRCGQASFRPAELPADYAKAIPWFHKISPLEPAAGNWLGLCYRYGYGVKINPQLSFTLLKTSGFKEDPDAQCNLGIYYSQGAGADFPEGAAWFQKASAQGHAIAQYKLAMCYKLGRGEQPSMEKFLRWCRKSAEQGYADAQYELGIAYGDGKGVERDILTAAKWLKSAADQQHAGAAQAYIRLFSPYYTPMLNKAGYYRPVR